MRKAALWPRMLGILVALGLGLYYIGFVILGYHVGSSGYQVRVRVPSAAGVFADGSVTYRGVQVGTIDRLDLSPDGVDLVLDIKSKYHIPANAHANVKMLSALGEQYVDLVPTSSSGPMLHDGSTIPQSRTTVPVQIGQVLSSAKNLLSSVDPADLQAVQTLLATAFTDVTPQLKRLVQTGQDLTQALIAAKDGTRLLIDDGATVLQAGNASSTDFTTYVAALDTLSKQFADSNADFANLLAGGGGSLAQIEDLIETESQPFRDLLSGAGAAGSALAGDSVAVQELFALLPSVTAKLGAAVQGGNAGATLLLNDGQPVCSYGSGVLPLPGVTSAGGSPLSCPARSGLQQRGPQHAPSGG